LHISLNPPKPGWHCFRLPLHQIDAEGQCETQPANFRALGAYAWHHAFYILPQDIEEDPSRLLSTGLFKSCKPIVFPPSHAGEFYPTFLQVGAFLSTL